MSTRSGPGSTVVEVSKPVTGSGWGKVAAMAAVGFVVGVFWPRLLGMRPGPSAPPEAVASATVATPEAPPETLHAPAAPLPAAATLAPLPSADAVPPVLSNATALANPPSVSVGHGYALSCRSSEGTSAKGAACGGLGGLDGAFVPRLRRLVQCEAAASASGKLQLVVTLDFDRNAVSVESGKGSTVADPAALLACAKSGMKGAGIASLAHEQSKYSLLYTVNFGASQGAGTTAAANTNPKPPARHEAAPAAPEAPAAPPVAVGASDSSGGMAPIVWEVGIVRDAPHKTAGVVTRLPKGTQVRLGASKDGWFEVRYGADFASHGWLFAGAVGK